MSDDSNSKQIPTPDFIKSSVNDKSLTLKLEDIKDIVDFKALVKPNLRVTSCTIQDNSDNVYEV